MYRTQTKPAKYEYENKIFAPNTFTGAANARVKLEQVSAGETVERGYPDWWRHRPRPAIFNVDRHAYRHHPCAESERRRG